MVPCGRSARLGSQASPYVSLSPSAFTLGYIGFGVRELKSNGLLSRWSTLKFVSLSLSIIVYSPECVTRLVEEVAVPQPQHRGIELLELKASKSMNGAIMRRHSSSGHQSYVHRNDSESRKIQLSFVNRLLTEECHLL